MRIPALLALLLATPTADAGALAVLYFDVDAPGSDYDPLGRGLANMLITDLDKVSGLDIVERERLNAILDELNLQRSDFVDPRTAARVGEGLGAADVLIGGITVTGGQMRIDARVVDVQTGLVRLTARADGEADRFFKIEEKLVRTLVKGLDAQPSKAVEASFTRRAEGTTDNAVAYAKAVTAYDSGERSIGTTLNSAAAGSADGKRLAREFEADIKPLPPYFASIDVAFAERFNQYPGVVMAPDLSLRIAAGLAPSEAFQAFVRLSLIGTSAERNINVVSTTEQMINRVSLNTTTIGIRRQVREVPNGWASLVLGGSLGLGSQRLVSTYSSGGSPRPLAWRPIVAPGGALGVDWTLLRHERPGVTFGATATAQFMALGQGHGMLGVGSRVVPGAEVHIGYIGFGGER